MASTVFRNRSNNPQMDTTTNQQMAVNNIVNQIMGSTNPQETFNSYVNSNPELKNYYELMNRYGNGDPKAAFMAYAQQNGKSAMAQMIMQRLGLK